MTDTYLKSKTKDELEVLRSSVVNMIGPVQGIPAQDCVGEDGVTVHESSKGDPEYWYACIRAPFSVTPYDGLEACSEGEGEAVLGVWS